MARSQLSKVSHIQRDYLAEIYYAAHMERDTADIFVTSAQLAERLFASQSSVNRILDRLRALELIRHERYVGVQLTETGEQEAIALIRKQAIIESFITTVMEFDWYEAYAESRRMRHHVSDRVLERMWKLAGHPMRSPFGEFIDIQQAWSPNEIPLNEAEPLQDYQISRVLTRQQDRLDYLAALGLNHGRRLYLLNKSPFDGPLQIQLGEEYRILGFQLAKMLTVTPVSISNST